MLECIDHFYGARNRNNKIFMFLIQKLVAKHIFECFEKRKGEDGKKLIL